MGSKTMSRGRVNCEGLGSGVQSKKHFEQKHFETEYRRDKSREKTLVSLVDRVRRPHLGHRVR